jgi:hypothetical protein
MSRWAEHLVYDETSPTCLVRKYDWLCGRPDSRYLREPAGSPAGTVFGDGYIRVNIAGEQSTGHRIIWEMHNGEIPPEKCIDHIDGDPSNNKISNLRCIDRFLNSRNMRMKSTNKSGVTGVRLHDNNGGNLYWVALWTTEVGKQASKYFSIDKLGEDAFTLAVAYRKKMLDSINKDGAGFTERHGECTK